jgi:hypothetical protein
MVGAVGSEIEQLVFEIFRRSEPPMIQIPASKGAGWPFHEWMGQGNVRDGLDLCHLQHPQIGLPLLEPVEWVVVGAEVLGHLEWPLRGAVEHPTECNTIDRAGVDAEGNDPARAWIMTTRTQWVRNVADSHLNRTRLQRMSFMWPGKVSQEGPRGSCPRVERQGDLLGDSRTP